MVNVLDYGLRGNDSDSQTSLIRRFVKIHGRQSTVYAVVHCEVILDWHSKNKYVNSHIGQGSLAADSLWLWVQILVASSIFTIL